MKSKSLLIGLILSGVSFISSGGLFSSPEVSKVEQITNDTLRICFTEAFDNNDFIFSLSFDIKEDKPFKYGNHFELLLTPTFPKSKDEFCSSNIRIADYLSQGNSTPKELREILYKIKFSSFEFTTVTVATPEGLTTLTRTIPDEIVYRQTFRTAKPTSSSKNSITTKSDSSTPSPQETKIQIIKKSKSGICHDKFSRSYKRTKNFVAYDSIQECLDSGGLLPKN